MRSRCILWLLALTVYLLPSFAGPAASADRTSHATQPHAAAMTDCGHEAPPPPCPEDGKAAHAAGLCCPLMTGTPALLPSQTRIGPKVQSALFAVRALPHLIGLSPHTDPPPPRV